jgi:hypothetical protein
MEKGLKGLYVEGLAIHDGPESCVGSREGVGEVLTGVRAGWAIEPRNSCIRGADALQMAEGNTAGSVFASCRRVLRGQRTCACARSTKPEPCRWTRTPGRTVPLWADELPEQHSKRRSRRRRRSVVAARAWVSVSAASPVVVFSGVVRLGELRSRACRCSRGHRPSGCDTGATGRRVTLPQRHRRGVGGSLTQTPRRRAYRLQRPCSLPIVSA